MSEVFIVRVIPIHYDEQINFREPTSSIRLVDTVLGDRQVLPSEDVVEALMFWADGSLLPQGSDDHARKFMAQVHFWLAVADPESPFGAAVNLGGGPPSTVCFRGAWFDRDRHGVLRPLSGSRDEDPAWLHMDAELHEQLQRVLDDYKP